MVIMKTFPEGNNHMLSANQDTGLNNLFRKALWLLNISYTAIKSHLDQERMS